MLVVFENPSVTMNMLLRWHAYWTTEVFDSNCAAMFLTAWWVGVPFGVIEFR